MPTRFRPFLHALVMVVAALVAADLPAADSPADGDAPEAEIPTAPVRVDGRTLFRVRGVASLPAAERAEAIARRIEAAAGKPALRPGALTLAEGSLGLEIMAGDLRVMRVTDADAAIEGITVAALGEVLRDQIAQTIVRYREERTPAALLRSALQSAAATAVLLLALALLAYGFRWLDRRLETTWEQRRKRLEGTLGQDVVRSVSVLGAIRSSLRSARLVVGAVLVFAWIDVVLARFPWTRWISEGLTDFLVQPVQAIAVAIAGYVPNLLFLLVLAVIVRFGLRLLRIYFSAIEHGKVVVAHFDRDWSMPTYKILRALVLIIALVMAYPYLPGAGSAAFQGISVFAGLLVSLGAASSVSNVIAGYLVTYGRIMRTGDWVRVGEVIGVVTHVRLLTTRVRTVRNEEVTIPNATIMSSSITNYTALARDRGLILQAEVGIGYETPWRQVHAMLLEAARRTPGLRSEPAAFVLQRSLGDFAVVYQLNVFKEGEPAGMLLVQSALYQNIQDVFNEYGVQIMTPAYVADTPEPKVVPKDQWYLAPARPAEPGGGTAAGPGATPPASP